MRRFPFSTQLHEGKCVMWERIKAAPVITGAVFAIIGIILAVGGAQLVQLGYTLYYLLAGLGLIASGVLFALGRRSEEHTSELQSLMRISYAVFCLKKKKQQSQLLYLT